MTSILRDIQNRIRDAELGKICKCHKPSLLTFPDIEDNFQILDTKELEVVDNDVQFTRTEVTALCTVCKTLWLVEITSSSDRRTRVWKKQG